MSHSPLTPTTMQPSNHQPPVNQEAPVHDEREASPPHEEHVLTENDVLMGRGSGPNGNPGNIRLRKLVWQVYLDELRASDPRYKGFSFDDDDKNKQSTFPLPLPAVKGRIRKQVMTILKARGGRFLRSVSQERVAAASNPKKDGRKKQETILLVRNKHRPTFYAVEATPQEAKNKIRQALRFQMDRRGEREEEIRIQALGNDTFTASHCPPPAAIMAKADISGVANTKSLSKHFAAFGTAPNAPTMASSLAPIHNHVTIPNLSNLLPNSTMMDASTALGTLQLLNQQQQQQRVSSTDNTGSSSIVSTLLAAVCLDLLQQQQRLQSAPPAPFITDTQQIISLMAQGKMNGGGK